MTGPPLSISLDFIALERFSAAVRGSAESGRIPLLVSHRFSTVRMADRIVVLDGARVVDSRPLLSVEVCSR